MLCKKELALIAGLLIAILITPVMGFGSDCAAVRRDTLRLHVLARSDSPEAQADKLAVRDAILAMSGMEAADGVDEAIRLAGANLPRIRAAAEDALRLRGSDDKVTARLCRCYFETRDYGEFTLPAGEYTAVRVEIGEGGGRNWWCVMYPPLCLPAARAESGDKAGEDTEKIAGLRKDPEYRLSFAAVEWIEGLCERLRDDSPVE